MAAGMAFSRGMAALKPIICVASVMIRPLKPSSCRSTSFRSSGASVAGRISSSRMPGRYFCDSARWQMWPTMTASIPSSMRPRYTLPKLCSHSSTL